MCNAQDFYSLQLFDIKKNVHLETIKSMSTRPPSIPSLFSWTSDSQINFSYQCNIHLFMHQLVCLKVFWQIKAVTQVLQWKFFSKVCYTNLQADTHKFSCVFSLLNSYEDYPECKNWICIKAKLVFSIPLIS